MEDPYKDLTEKLTELFKARSDDSNSNRPPFLDQKESLEEFISSKLDRTALYESLKSLLSDEHLFSQWLPIKVRLSFLSSFERDLSSRFRNRRATFEAAKVREASNAEILEGMLPTLDSIGDQ